MTDWKTINAQRLTTVHPLLCRRVNAFLEHMAANGVPVLVTQALRTYEEQAALYAKGRTAPGPKVTNAQPGYSSHNFGLAVDAVPDEIDKAGLTPDWNPMHPAWQQILTAAKTYGLAEGAEWRSFPDFPHLYLHELKDTPTDQMRVVYTSDGLEAVWDLIDQELAASGTPCDPEITI